MSDVAELRKNYDKLRKDYKDLPKFSDFTLVFGFPKAEEAVSMLELFRAVKKTPFKAAHWVMCVLSPSDTIMAHDSHVTKDRRDELVEAMKSLVIADKKLSMVSFKASQEKDPEKVMAAALGEVTSGLKDTALFLQAILELTAEAWEHADEQHSATYYG
jgi:hypothetical protein